MILHALFLGADSFDSFLVRSLWKCDGGGAKQFGSPVAAIAMVAEAIDAIYCFSSWSSYYMQTLNFNF